MEPVAIKTGTAKFDLSLSLWEEAGELRGNMEYNSRPVRRLYDTPKGHFQTVLEGIVEDLDQPLSPRSVPLLTVPERQQALVAWNATQSEYPTEMCVHHLFEAQAEHTPDTVAVVFEDTPLTFQDLNRRANQLAHYLRRLGVGPDTLVGLCVARSLEMVIGVLGILKAGGAYVPLDPTYPPERLTFMLEDAKAWVLLTQQQLLKDLPRHGARVVCLDTDWQSLSRESEENPCSGVTAENLAYTIYTSGSTGKPKGVAMTHRPLCNLMTWQQCNSALPRGARTLQFASLSFDVSFQEMF